MMIFNSTSRLISQIQRSQRLSERERGCWLSSLVNTRGWRGVVGGGKGEGGWRESVCASACVCGSSEAERRRDKKTEGGKYIRRRKCDTRRKDGEHETVIVCTGGVRYKMRARCGK